MNNVSNPAVSTNTKGSEEGKVNWSSVMSFLALLIAASSYNTPLQVPVHQSQVSLIQTLTDNMRTSCQSRLCTGPDDKSHFYCTGDALDTAYAKADGARQSLKLYGSLPLLEVVDRAWQKHKEHAFNFPATASGYIGKPGTDEVRYALLRRCEGEVDALVNEARGLLGLEQLSKELLSRFQSDQTTR